MEECTMSLDDTFREMKRFSDELTRFNDKLKSSQLDLDSKHETVSPLWQDEMRREYDAEWNYFREILKNYLSRESPRYELFLETKLKHLSQYLRGGR